MREAITISFWRGVLPHWEIVDGHYFVTMRLADTLPEGKADELTQILHSAEDSDYLAKSRRYFAKLESWLDRNEGCQHLGVEPIARMVVDTIAHYEAAGFWTVMAYSLLPNHMHLFFRSGSVSMSSLMRRFQRYTGRADNALLSHQGQRFWQREWFDHWSRSVQEDDKIISYIRNNPVRAGFVTKPEDWPWSR